jgi:hypothetical protein
MRKVSGQVTGGTQRRFRTVAVSRPWRGWKGSAAPGLPGRTQGYSMQLCMSIAVAGKIPYHDFYFPYDLFFVL